MKFFCIGAPAVHRWCGEILKYRTLVLTPAGGPILTPAGGKVVRVIAADKIRAKILDLGYGGAAEGGQIVILQHVYHQPSIIGGPITHNNGGKNP